MLQTLADSFANSGIQPIVATEPVEGDATQVASKYVDFMLSASKLSSCRFWQLTFHLRNCFFTFIKLKR
jgi:hypothetical protein